ncbi:alpha/beta-hydrolase [Zopfochytrium polystomum]|nr:alpha/beta-hydrolase [Zopfochytrium polystomum]
MPKAPTGLFAVVAQTRTTPRSNSAAPAAAGEGVRLHYHIHGNGPIRVFFIMGLHVTLHGWENQANYFGSLADYTCVVYDNRGVGWSDAPSGRYTTSEMAKDAYDLLMVLGWTRNVHVVGVSMGGMIAQELCLLAPEIIASLCLTSTHAGRSLPPPNAFYYMPQIIFSKDPVRRMNLMCDLLFPQDWLSSPSVKNPTMTNREATCESFKHHAALTRSPPSPAGAFGQLAAVSSHHVSAARLQKIAASGFPVFVITGTYDNLIYPSNSYHLAKILKAEKFHVFKGSGHALMTEVAEEYNTMLREFIESTEARRSQDGKL